MSQAIRAGEAAAALALAHLERARSAAKRLKRGKDRKALHDLRTSLRRLRVVLSVYRDVLGPAARKRLRRRLRELSRRTGPARDAQVWSAWLRRGGHKCHTTAKLIEHLDAVAEHCRREFLAEGLPELKTLGRRLEERLRGVEPGPEPFAAAARAAARRESRRLAGRLAALQGAGSPAALHRLRIQAKRLRYVLEPLAGAGALVRELRRLQDLLGTLHDLHQLSACAVPQAADPARRQALRLGSAFRRDWLRSGRIERLAAAGTALRPD